MKYVVFIFLIFVVFVRISIYQSDDHITLDAKNRIKTALDIATHDASLEVDKIQLNQGSIMFTSNARIQFNEALQSNLKLDENFFPLGDNILRNTDQLEVVVYDEVDVRCPGASFDGFPCLYKNEVYDFYKVLNGPSVVAIVTMKAPRPYAISQDLEYIVGSSHEFKPF